MTTVYMNFHHESAIKIGASDFYVNPPAFAVFHKEFLGGPLE
jgi:hypothetical protein